MNPATQTEARRLVLGRQLNSHCLELRNYLVETCTLMGERIPEYDEWLEIEFARKAEHERQFNELEGDPQGMMLLALNKLVERSKHDLAVKQQKVGRNDPCPCGSGKKLKQCCRKQQR